ncbi:MAG: response regulator [Deltaproteobacteria bacterium]|nr:response regulator [Deltaproteobacteria bacterium]
MNLNLTYITPSIMNQQGYTIKEAKDRTLEESFAPDSLKLALKDFEEELEIERNKQADLLRSRTIAVEVKCKDGSTKWTEAKMSFLRNRDQYGQGTTFSIFFPVVEKQVDIETEPVEELPTGNERILFVDDEESILYAGRISLERLGYQVEVRLNPVEALELFRANPDHFDLVITDMTMPKMTGDQLVREILKIRPDMSIIIARQIGIRQYIEKPLNRRILAKVVREVLDDR